MLSAEMNERLTRVGPGTPMGRLLRWYWHPIAAATQLDENPVQRVKLLGESLVLYRDRRGNLGLLADACAHRRVNLIFGIPESEGLRCPYHGWLYDGSGQCLEMPQEPLETTFPSRVKIQAYPVQELSGLIFAYLGPGPAPLLPRWDLLVAGGMPKDVGLQVVPCNWLQMQENDLDPAHVPWLHDYFSNYILERIGRPDLKRRPTPPQPMGSRTFARNGRLTDTRGWEPYEQGIMNTERFEAGWSPTRPSIFPNMNSFQTLFMYRVPMDDEHTMHVTLSVYPQPEGPAPPKADEKVPYYTVPQSVDFERKPVWGEMDNNGGQDIAAWVAQGAIVDRTEERLAETDQGVILWRELLERQLRIVEDGGEPMNVFRDPASNERILVPPRTGAPPRYPGIDAGFMRRVNATWVYSPIVQRMVIEQQGEEALTRPVF